MSLVLGEKAFVCHIAHFVSTIPIISLKARSSHTFLRWLLPPPPAASALVTCHGAHQSESLTASSESSSSVHPDPL